MVCTGGRTDVSYFTFVSHFLLYLGPIGLVNLLVAKAMGAAQVVVTGKVFFLNILEWGNSWAYSLRQRHKTYSLHGVLGF